MADSPAAEILGSPGLYSGLPLTTNDSIRILDLQPGKPDDDIRITLRVVALSSRPEYKALSYTWGRSDEARSVAVNDEYQLPVTDNLFRALRRLRNQSKTRTMWVDAICINQADIPERNQQVKLMGTIYREASCVDIWLGDCRQSARALVRRITREYEGGIIEAIKASSTYWHRRVWTIQEFVLAKQTFLCFGSTRIRFQLKSRDVTTLTTEDAVFADFRDAFAIRLDATKKYTEQRRFTILTATPLLWRAQSTDKRDMVYSILGLIKEREVRLLDVDYNTPCCDVYAQATSVSLMQEKSFEILSYVQFRPSKVAGLSTWCVDFASIPSINLIGAYSNWEPLSVLTGLDMRYMQRLYELEIRFPRVSLDARNKFLSIGGVACDEISRLISLSSREDPTKPFNAAERKELHSMIQQAMGFTDIALQAQNDIEQGYRYGLTLLRELVALASEDVGYTDYWNSFGLSEDLSMRPFFREWSQSLRARVGKGAAILPKFLDVADRKTRNKVVEMWRYTAAVAGGRSLFVTKSGLIGLAPSSAATGDIVVLVANSWPFVLLRPTGQHFTFRGFAYVHGFMHHAFWDHWSGDEFRPETFVLQ